MATATHTHVFYTDAHNGWCAMQLDSEDNQVGEANYSYLKADAVSDAKSDKLPVHVYGKSGLYQRTA